MFYRLVPSSVWDWSSEKANPLCGGGGGGSALVQVRQRRQTRGGAQVSCEHAVWGHLVYWRVAESKFKSSQVLHLVFDFCLVLFLVSLIIYLI